MSALPEKHTVIQTYYDDKEVSMVLPSAHHLAALSMYLQKSVRAFYHHIELSFRPIEYIVDVGAHVGLWTIPFKLIFPKAKILAIEPSKYNYPMLWHNAEPYRPDIDLLKIALGDETGEISIACPTIIQKPKFAAGDTGLISIYGLGNKWRERVPIDKLDNIVSKRVDWLKVDTEGAEEEILLGAKETIMRDRPILQIEMRQVNQDMAKNSVWLLLHLIGNDYGYISVGEIRGDLLFVPKEIHEKSGFD